MEKEPEAAPVGLTESIDQVTDWLVPLATALVGNKRLALGRLAHADFGAQCRNLLRHEGLGKRNHFDGKRKCSQHGHLLAGIGNDHELARRR